MRQKQIILSVLMALILVFSTSLAFNVYMDYKSRQTDDTDDTEDVSPDVVVDEVNESLLDEDDGVEIGDMI